MTDRIFEACGRNSLRNGLALVRESDCVKLVAGEGDPPRKFAAEFTCRGLVRENDGTIVKAEKFIVGISFPEDYLRGVPDVRKMVTLLSPGNVWHPNVLGPFMCVGNVRPGTDLAALLLQVYEILPGRNLRCTTP